MHATINQQKPTISQLVKQFPRKHLAAASSVIAAVFVCLMLVPGEDAEATRIIQPLALELTEKINLDSAPQQDDEPHWTEMTVGEGDNLSTIFQRASLSAADVYDIVSNSKDSKGLLRLYPGQKLALQVDPEGELQALQLIHNPLETTLFERADDAFTTTHIKREPEIRQNYSSAIITSSLYTAAQNSGLSQDLIMELANIFGGVIDFVYDVRTGDNFTVLYEENFLDDEKTGNGAILAAQFTNRGKTHTAYRYIHDDGSVDYYSEEGVSMRKAFLRAPLDFTRISSGFNLKRLHPIFKTTKPHRGIDYAASTGTPVYAAGDGRVVASGYSNANGNYVILSHGSQYQTKYLHLQKRGVKSGQKVRQQQIIGWVGSTGYATGPHLHYEFLVNGTHRNPRTIVENLPKAKSLNSNDKERFLAQIGNLPLQLARYNNHSLVKAEQLSTATPL
jgi:murein DD-endopeptidase MepM/ murein hydrolase activator NlpD